MLSNKEILTIKILSVTAAVNVLAAGFVLMSNKKNDVTLGTQPTKTNYEIASENPIYSLIDENDSIIQNDLDINKDVKPPYKTNGEKKDLKPIPTMGPPYEPGMIDYYNALPVQRATPIMAEMYKINAKAVKTDSIEEKTPYMTELKKKELYEMDPRLEPTMGPPYKTEVSIEDYSINPPYIPDEAKGKENVHINPIKEEIDKIKAANDSSLSNIISDSAPYMTELKKKELYEMDPRLEPTMGPPYKQNNAGEDSENYNKSM